jgi:hypothetical protein
MVEKVIAVLTAVTFAVLIIVGFIDIELFREMWAKALEVAILIGILYIVYSLFHRG